MRSFPDELPLHVFSAAQVRELDRLAIDRCGVTAYELMSRAGAAAFSALRTRWPEARSIVVAAGPGNNGGDGLIVARLARAAGFEVRVCLLAAAERLKGEAALAAEACRSVGVELGAFAAASFARADVVVDALLGTGLARPVTAEFATAIEVINRAGPPVLALDVPSGLDADSGLPYPLAVRADATITFVGLKQGLFLGAGPDWCGEIVFAGLDLPPALAESLEPALTRLGRADLVQALPRRLRTTHKGACGRVLLVGGGPGMPGAIRLAAEAALRTGAGLVYVCTHPENVGPVLSGRPEIICRATSSVEDLDDLMKVATAVVIGPGLGRSAWARELFQAVLTTDQPLVVDADGLNLLANEPKLRDRWLLTPHPAEAARLLGWPDAARVQRERREAVSALAQRYGATVVLKGANTLVAAPGEVRRDVCDRGNPGMATAGTGDALAGVLGALVAQTGDVSIAARAGVLLHALAGDAAALAGERGMIASDLLPQLRVWANPHS